MPWQSPSDEQLDEWAETHVRYEVQLLVSTAIEFRSRYPRMPDADEFREPTVDDALLESALVHARLINEFLVGDRHEYAISASDWISSWSHRALPIDTVKMIDAQVAHLSSRRTSSQPWDVPSYAYACCQGLQRFLVALHLRRPERSAAFEVARLHVARGTSELAP